MDLPVVAVKELSRDIIKVYTSHVRDKVKEGRKDYIKTGIDDDLEKYKEVFLDVLCYTLGHNTTPREKTKVHKESKKVITKLFKDKTNKTILTKHRLMIYTTCEVMFEMVMEEIKNNENK